MTNELVLDIGGSKEATPAHITMFLHPFQAQTVPPLGCPLAHSSGNLALLVRTPGQRGLWPQPEGHFTSAHHTALEALRVGEDWSSGTALPSSQPLILQTSASEGPWQNEEKKNIKCVEALKQGEHEAKNTRINQQ